MKHRSFKWLHSLAIGVVVSLLAVPGLAAATSYQAPNDVRPNTDISLEIYAAPAGAGKACVRHAPCTLQEAQDKVRKFLRTPAHSSDRREGDVVVYLRGGTYELTETLRFDERDSGSPNAQVIYRNYPGETPVISGGRQIIGWQPDSDGVYKTLLPEVRDGQWRFDQLFVDGARQTLARYPNSGYLRTDDDNPVEGGEFTSFRYRAGEVDPSLDYSDASVYVWAVFDWFSFTFPIESVDGASGVISHSGRTRVTADNRYFLQGVREFLDEPGEFYLDTDSGWLYYWPSSDRPIEEQEIVAPTLSDVVEVKGSSPDRPAEWLVFEGLTFSASQFVDLFDEHAGASPQSRPARVWRNRPNDDYRHGLLRLENASNVTIRGNGFRNAGLNAVALDYYTSNSTVQGNDIGSSGYHGILSTGTDVGTLVEGEQIFDNHDNEISDNYIHDIGRLVGHGAGIFLYQSGENEIIYNKIRRGPRYGIGIKGASYHIMPVTLGGVPVTWENHWDFNTGRKNYIAHNDVAEVAQDSDDMGGISLWGVHENIITNNRIHDMTATEGVGNGVIQGIYSDGGADRQVISKNVIYDVVGPVSGPIFVKGLDTQVTNNIFVGSVGARFAGIEMRWRLVEPVELPPRDALPVEDHHYARNIMYSEAGAPMFFFVGWSGERVEHSNHNLFYDPTGTYGADGIPGDQTLANWLTLDDNKYDQESLITDPLFVDPDGDNYNLRAESPAFSLGFEDFDQTDVGPRPTSSGQSATTS